MRASLQGALVLVVAGGLALPVWGQGSWVQSSSSSGSRARPAQTPFTAEYKITRVKTLANGTTITRESTEVRAVDSEGRVMEARTETPASEDRKPVSIVSVSDPVAGTRTHWNTPGTKATVIPMPPHVPGPACFTTATTSTPMAPGGAGTAEPSSISGGLVTFSSSTPFSGGLGGRRAKPVIEDLGTTSIQGIEARGRRITRTTPAGAMGNDAPLVHTQETWTATGIGPSAPLVRSVIDDPESGRQTTELVNLTLSEPDLATFQPPEGYEVVVQEMHQVPCQNAPAQ